MRVANRLCAILNERQLTQTDLAEMTGLPYAVIRRMMRQGCNPPLHLALLVSRVLDVPIQQLYSVERTMRGSTSPPAEMEN
jgi:DNA-binding XRE family transcriptional regulator